jgi:hypothetical protein
LRAHRGETLQASEILAAARRIIVVSTPRTISAADDVAVIELPPARRWLSRELTIVGAGFRLAPAAGEHVLGDIGDCQAARLMPLLNDRHDEADSWVVVG